MHMVYAHDLFDAARLTCCQSASASRRGRRAVNVTLPEPLIHEARALGINISGAFEAGLAASVAAARATAGREENRAAIDAWNEYVEENGIPLSEFRQF